MKRLADLGQLKKALADKAAQQELERKALELARAKQALEADFFRRSIGPCTPLPAPNLSAPSKPRPEPLARQRQQDEEAALAASLSDEIDISSLLESDSSLSYRREGVGPEVPQRLRKGHWSIRAQIDLHGLRVDEAREALATFLNDSLRNEVRCVRVIHGKGLGSVNREPVLKGKVLKWLVQRSDVLAFTQARPNDGGAGALIVLMKGNSHG